jgi:hypothetical protein
MALRVGNDGISCHTRSRFGEPWPLGDSYHYTFIHFSQDDALPLTLGPALDGWWKVTWRHTDYYYLYDRKGKVGYTKTKPLSAQQRTATFQGTGYWFEQGAGKHAICWTSTGSLEKFGPGAQTGAMQGIWNDGEPLAASKM